MVDYELLLPPVETLGHSHVPGRPDLVTHWLETEACDVDCIILSLDMLAYGGLVASRELHTPLEAAQERLNVIARLQTGPHRPALFGLSVITSLTPSASAERALPFVAKVRRWGELAGRVAELCEATDEDEQRQLESEVPTEVLQEYLAVRERNHQLNLRAVEEAGAGRLDFLLLAQDEAAPHGLHHGEQQRLTEAVDRLDARARVAICPGIDAGAQLLLARFVLQHMEVRPKVAVRFARETDADRVAAVEDRTLRETVAAHIRALGGEMLDNCEGADLHLFIHAAEAGPGPRPAATGDPMAAWVEHIQQVIENERLAAVADVANPDGADAGLIGRLRENVALHRLASYAGREMPGNAVGTALAHSALRIIALRDKGAFDLAHLLGDFQPMRYLELLHSLIDSERAHVQFLFGRFVDDWGYQTLIRPRAVEHLKKLLDTADFDLREAHHEAEGLVRGETTRLAGELYLQHFLGQECLGVGAGNHRSKLVLCELEETKVALPWQRLAEVDVEFDFGIQLVSEERQAAVP